MIAIAERGGDVEVTVPTSRAAGFYNRLGFTETATYFKYAPGRGVRGGAPPPLCETTLGPDHPDTLTTRHELARWRGWAGDEAAAISAFEALLKNQLRVLDHDHPDTLTTGNNLTFWQGCLAEDAAGAVSAFVVLLEDTRRLLGPNHIDTLTARGHLARWRGLAGDTAGAASAFEALLKDARHMLGPDHPGTLRTRHNLTSWQETRDNLAHFQGKRWPKDTREIATGDHCVWTFCPARCPSPL